MRIHLKCVLYEGVVASAISGAILAAEKPVERAAEWNYSQIYWRTSAKVSSETYDMRLICKNSITEILRCQRL